MEIIVKISFYQFLYNKIFYCYEIIMKKNLNECNLFFLEKERTKRFLIRHMYFILYRVKYI